MKKQFVSMLLVLAVLASAYTLLTSANSMSTVTTTFTSTYMTIEKRSTTVSTFHTTYMQTHTITIPGWGPYDLVAGDKIIITGSNAKGTFVAIYDGWGRMVHQFRFVSEGYEQKIFEVPPGKDGPYRLEYGWPGMIMAPCPISIKACRTQIDWTTSSNFVVQQYITSILTEITVTKTETGANWFESPVMIGMIVVAVAVIIMALLKGKSKPKQPQLEKYS